MIASYWIALCPTCGYGDVRPLIREQPLLTDPVFLLTGKRKGLESGLQATKAQAAMQSKTKNRLVIVEGLTGLGKSTLAHWIARQYEYNGIAARWVHEGEDPHPVSINIEDDPGWFMAESLKKWTAFVDQVQEFAGATIIEASFFNNLIETLFAHSHNIEQIVAFGMELQRVIQPARPALVYLTHPDISAALEKNFRNRGPGFREFVRQLVAGTPIGQAKQWVDDLGIVAFWSEFVALTNRLFRAYEIDKLELDISTGDWARCHQQVVDFLDLPLVEDPSISPEAAEKFVGVYQFQEDGKQHRVQYENGFLVTDVFMDVKTKLIPLTDLSFAVEKWHFELQFDRDEAGEVRSFVIGGRDVDYLKAVGHKATKVAA